MIDLDRTLAERFGGYASYVRTDEPARETYGDGPAEEMDRLLDRFCQSESRVLDLGCGAGFTLCRLAPQVAEIWGFDEEPDLLEATQQRITHLGLNNAHAVWGMLLLQMTYVGNSLMTILTGCLVDVGQTSQSRW